MAVFKFSRLDFLFTCLGLGFLLLDIALDVWAAVNFYQEKAYISLAFLVVFLLGSSLLVQAFSWLWYSYEGFKMNTTVEKCPSRVQLTLLHVFQLGIYLRHAGVFEVSLCSFFQCSGLACIKEPKDFEPEGFAVFLSHDLSLLRLIETFSESAPQLVLMLTIFLQQGQFEPVTGLKALGSAAAIAFSITMYHRALRSFLKDKATQQIRSSILYFLWNLMLIMSRVVALALFASVLPCFIVAHFLCSWVVLVFFTWRCKTDFMDSPGGEWLFRATVGLIWYFSWFNVTDGRTQGRMLIYHGYKVADISLLCGLWYWKMIIEEQQIQWSDSTSLAIAVGVVCCYVLGLLLKLLYYKCLHPNLTKQDLKGDTTQESREDQMYDEPDCARATILALSSDEDTQTDGSSMDSMNRGFTQQPTTDTTRYNKRMRKIAENFFTS